MISTPWSVGGVVESATGNGAPAVGLGWAEPRNSGATMIVFSRAFSGIFESSETIGPMDSGCFREAPFGVPVVPLVRMIARPGSDGGTGSAGSPRSISWSRVASSVSSESCHATNRFRRVAASLSSSVNSSS